MVSEEKHLLVKKSKILMGTSVTIMIVSRDIEYSEEVMDNAFNEIKKVEAMMSVFNEESEVSRLNRQGYLENASEELIWIIKEAEKISKLTDGIFDITVAPLIEYIDKNFLKDRTSFEEGLRSILELVDYSSVKVEGRRIRFLKKGMKIVLNAIAKGYAADLAAETLKKCGIRNALINAGGDIRTIGGKTDKEPWRIGIRDPFHKEQNITIIKLHDGAVATSGSYERRIAQGILSHIVNPKRPLASEQVISSTVICERTLVADALATSLCLMDPKQGIDLVEKLDNAEAMLIMSDRKILRTSKFAAYECTGCT
ncbi:MAG: FAD:protein FMN transferase [Nitrososphaerota archaeon]